jgi:hypothetical protein
MKFHLEDEHLMPLCSCEFRENRRSESPTLLWGVSEILFEESEHNILEPL